MLTGPRGLGKPNHQSYRNIHNTFKGSVGSSGKSSHMAHHSFDKGSKELSMGIDATARLSLEETDEEDETHEENSKNTKSSVVCFDTPRVQISELPRTHYRFAGQVRRKGLLQK